MSPCPISLSTDATATTSSSRSALPASASKTDSSATHAAFHHVLSKVDHPPTHDREDENDGADDDDDRETDSTNGDDSVSSGDQRALMLAMSMPLAAGQPVPGTIASVDASAAVSQTFTLQNANGQTAAQLLAAGKQVLEFQCNQNAATDATDASAAAAQASADASSAAAAANAAPSASASLPAAADKSAKLEALGKAGKAGAPKVNLSAAKASGNAAEKFAAKMAAAGEGGGNSSTSSDKNQSLAPNLQTLKQELGALGTTAANGVKSMVQDAFNPALSAGATSTVGTSSAASTTAAVSASADSRAADLVHQIGSIADGLWAVGRTSVEVKFNFSDQDQLSVRVQYRNGEVQATFRTDSPTVRDAITREWQSQMASSDTRPYRVADPVFTASGHDSGTFAGDFSRQQSQSQQRSASESADFDRAFPFSSPRSAASTTATAAPAAPARSETPGLLHALV